jgi:predicted nucleic acid-binding protein
MADVLFDTSGAFALIIPRDQFHRQARAFVGGARNLRLHIPEVVLGETYTTLRRRQGYQVAMRWVDGVLRSSTIVLHRPEPDDYESAWSVLREYAGVPLSYADASVVALGRATGIKDVFSFDTDFASCGMRLVPGS